MPNLVETVDRTGLFRTLVTAVRRAGLVPLLSVAGPFTVFAPTDEAFARLPAGAIENLLNDPGALTNLLACHIVPGRHRSADMASRSKLRTMQGQSVRIRVNGGVLVNDAHVVAPDVLTDNGIIHVIDRVLLPE